MIGLNIHYVKVDMAKHPHLQEMFLRTRHISGEYKGERILSVGWDNSKVKYIVTTEKNKEEEMYYCVNGDVVMASKTGDVFLYLGGMYYNLSSKKKEMRGRKAIKRDDGPITKLSNLANSGELFKEAVMEAVTSTSYDEPF